MSTVLLCGEGPHDVGRREWSIRRESDESTDGWLQPLVRRLRMSQGDDASVYLKQLLTLPGRHGPRPLAGLALKAQIAKFRAVTEGCSAVVLATDADSIDPRDHRDKVDAIDAGFDAYPGDVVAVPCVPMGTSEAWLLTDARVWIAQGATRLNDLPRRSEESWGHAHDPSSNHPKILFARICRDNDVADDTATRAAMANELRFGDLRRQCPVSYVAFEDRARGM